MNIRAYRSRIKGIERFYESRLGHAYTRWRNGLKRETWALPVDIFRVLAGVVGFAYFLTLLHQVSDFSSPDGLLDHELLQRIYGFTRLGLFHPGLGAWFFYAIYSLACLGCWGVILGYRTKLCAGFLFAIAVSAYRWNFIVMYVDDAIMHLVLFWLLLLPVGHTLTLADVWSKKRACLLHWRQCRVPGLSVRCLLANVCLVYLVAGLWKFESPMWHDGIALYITLQLPIAYTPELWGPQHLPWLRVANYAALVLEPVLPVLLLMRRGHPLKWFGLCAQFGFHLGIIATLRIPFANVLLMATAVLFFRHEIMSVLVSRDVQAPGVQTQAKRLDWGGRFAVVFLICLTLAMMRRLPIVGIVHQPAYALLWVVGIAQDYQLFNWIDRKNFSVRYRVQATPSDGRRREFTPSQLFPGSLRATLLQSYLHNIRWIAVPRRYRPVLKQTILQRFANRFCRLHPVPDRVSAWAQVQRVRSDRPGLQVRQRFLMDFRCLDTGAVLCRTTIDRRQHPDCLPVGSFLYGQPRLHRLGHRHSFEE